MDLGELLLHVERKTGAIVNVDAIHPAFYDGGRLSLTAGQHIHRGAFCAFAKRAAGAACFRAKDASRERARAGRPFSATCPHGVRERVCPVLHGGLLAAVVYLGHFRGDGWTGRAGEADFGGTPLPGWTRRVGSALAREGAFIATFIATELELWQEAGHGMGKHRSDAFYRDGALRFIERKFQDNIQLADLAISLGVTPNFLSHRLRTVCGRRFSELLTDKRLEHAAVQLEFHHQRDITEIAFLCGWRDSNYFSTVFRKRFGCTPTAYRARFARP